MNRTTKGPLKPLILILSIVGTIVFTVVGIFLFAFVIFPNLVSTDSIKSMVESKLNEAVAEDSKPKDSIAGASTSELNPFLQQLINRRLNYKWTTGEVHAYEFSFRMGDQQNSNFSVQGSCQYTVDNEKVDNNRTGIGTGTAIVIAPGYLATSLHVVQLAERMTFVSGSKRFHAKIVDIDLANDLALLAYEGDVPEVELSPSANLEVAQSVLILGFPMTNALETGISATEGKVSSSDAASSNAIAIDAAIDPGNSGGPVLNLKGEVVGLASATSKGGRIGPVGFATPVERLRELMTKHGISIKQSTADAVLEPKEIADRISPSVGLLEVSSWTDNHFYELDYLATYTGTIKSPVVVSNGVRKEGLTGRMTVSPFGETRVFSNVDSLPFVMASVPELLFQPFDMVAKDRWTVYRNYELPSQRSGPGSVRPQMLDRLRGRSSAEKQPGNIVASKSDFEIISSNQDADQGTVHIKKTRHMYLLSDNGQPSLEIKGDGVFEFDAKQGVPVSLEENLTVFKNADGKRTETALAFKVTRIDPSIVRERLQQAQELADKQKKDQEIERTQQNPLLIDELNSQITKTPTPERAIALKRLAEIALVEEKRDAILKSLRGVIASKEIVLHPLAWQAYRHWMNVACAPELRRILSKKSSHSDDALNALFELKLEEDLPLIVSNLSKLSQDAKKSLSAFGPKVESAVFEKLAAEEDTFAQLELLRILETVGTQYSIDRLSELKTRTDLSSKMRMEGTIRSITSRLEAAKK